MTTGDDPAAAEGADHLHVDRDVVAIGASAGGVEALCEVIGTLPAELPASVFVVLHLLPTAASVLPEILARSGSLPCVAPRDGETIEHGRVYVAPPDHHMLIEDGHLALSQGPRENGHRPAIDPLFRSAASSYGERVVGVVLSGALDDGTEGLRSIRSRGGIALVQDPRDALYPSMPQSAIDHNAADQVVPLHEMADAICRLVELPGYEWDAPMTDTLTAADQRHDRRTRGASSALTCPECGGALWEVVERGSLRFRCHLGHAYSPESLQSGQGEALEGALLAALRSMEERAELYRRLADRAEPDRERMLERAGAFDRHSDLLRAVITSVGGRPGDRGDEEADVAS